MKMAPEIACIVIFILIAGSGKRKQKLPQT